MTLPALATHQAGRLGTALLAHLDAQLRAAERMLDLVLQQGRAVRERDVNRVLTLVGQLQAETEARARLEHERTLLLQQAGTALGTAGNAITIDAFCTLLDRATADDARARSERLRGVLREVRDEHIITRALMRQELAFVDHLVRLLGSGEEQTGAYAPPTTIRATSTASAPPRHRLLDLQA